MKRLRLYFDTSIFNFALAEDVPAEKGLTLKLLEEVKRGKYEVLISEVVTREINRASGEKARFVLPRRWLNNEKRAKKQR